MTQKAATKATTKFTAFLVMAALLASLLPAIAKGQALGTTVSEVQKTATPFTSLAAKWHQETPEGASAELLVRFLINGQWGNWNELHGDEDGFTESDPENPVAYIATNKASAYQYKTVLTPNSANQAPKLNNIQFTPIHAAEEESALFAAAESAEVQSLSVHLNDANAQVAASQTSQTAAGRLSIVSRSQWGANESLRVKSGDHPEAQLIKIEDNYDQLYPEEMKIARTVTRNSRGEELTWPQAYAVNVSKFIVHHTATESNLDNPKQAIRDIYYYHAITRGWGDIGYNYIIDQRGNIYEGRAGGDGVVGAHAGRANTGSVGIAVLGNYQNNDVPPAVLESLAALMKVKAAKFGINLQGSSSFRGKVMPNVFGHRDVMSTSCPGEKLYKLLPTIAGLSGDALQSQLLDRRRNKSSGQDYDYDIVEGWPQFEMDAGKTEEIDLTIKNTGKQSWDASTYIIASNTTTTGFFENPDRVQSKAAGKTVKPGETITFVVPLKSRFKGGFTNLELFPLVNGTTAIQKYIQIPVQINAAHYDYNLVATTLSPKYPRKGQTVTATVTLQNTGNIAWEGSGKNTVNLGTENPRDKVSRLLETPGTRLARLNESKIEPGESGTFTVKLRAPNTNGYAREYFTPVVEGVTWMPSHGDFIEMYVSESAYSAEYRGTGNIGTFAPGQTKEVWAEFENTGRSVWNKTGSVQFKAEVTGDARGAQVSGAMLYEDKVPPGETGRVQFNVTAPQKPGTYRVLVQPKYGSRRLITRPVMLFIIVDDKAVDTGFVTSSLPRANAAATNTSTTRANTTTSSEGPSIRVGLGFKGSPVISGSGSFRLFDGSKDLSTYKTNDKVTVTYSGGKYRVSSPNGSYNLQNPPRFVPSGSTILRIDNYENRPSWKPEINDNQFRGNLEVHWYNGELKVVNELALEPYLRGLAEISATDPYEKIKAVIILARSYAYHYATGAEVKFPGAPYHLQDDPQTSQKYLGYGFEIRNQTGVRAVNDTAATVVYYNGKVIKTPYFSASNGKTRSAQEVWGWTNAPYLVSVDDPGCKGMTQSGHGVGLSGCGSKYWAEKGQKADEIIKYYFKGVDVKKAY